jgi:Tetrapyrrole (Corrin/Porphyrin) Methylases
MNMPTRKSTSISQPGSNEKAQSPSDNAEKIPSDAKRGSLVVIGTGIRTVGQLTLEAIAWMREADSLVYVVADPVAEAVIKHLNPTGAVSLAGYYEEGKPRINTYNAMVEHILRCVRAGNKTVAAFYGHPGVYTYPSHESIRRARSEGFPAWMLPGISSEDCLFADLGVDPGTWGCQSYEATDFLLHKRLIDPSSLLILWQVGALGRWKHSWQVDTRAMPLLVQRLAQFYPVSHPVKLYQAAILPGTDPIIDQILLSSLCEFPITAGMTLYIPPARARVPDPEMSRLLSHIMG